MKKFMFVLSILSSTILTQGAEIRIDNQPVLGLAYRGDGPGFVKMFSSTTSGCDGGWVYVTTPSAMSLFMAAQATNKKISIFVFENASSAVYVHQLTNTTCTLVTASM